jgi:hypothetical protein
MKPRIAISPAIAATTLPATGRFATAPAHLPQGSSGKAYSTPAAALEAEIAALKSQVQSLSEALEKISEVLYVHSDGSVELHSPKNVTIAAGKDAVISGMNKAAVQSLSASIECTPGGKVSMKATGSLEWATSGTFKINAVSILLDSPVTKVEMLSANNVSCSGTVVGAIFTNGVGNIL